jgi:hypothetical protein
VCVCWGILNCFWQPAGLAHALETLQLPTHWSVWHHSSCWVRHGWGCRPYAALPLAVTNDIRHQLACGQLLGRRKETSFEPRRGRGIVSPKFANFVKCGLQGVAHANPLLSPLYQGAILLRSPLSTMRFFGMSGIWGWPPICTPYMWGWPPICAPCALHMHVGLWRLRPPISYLHFAPAACGVGRWPPIALHPLHATCYMPHHVCGAAGLASYFHPLHVELASYCTPYILHNT